MIYNYTKIGADVNVNTLSDFKMVPEQEISIDGHSYNVKLKREVVRPPDAPRLVIVAYQPNKTAQDIVHVCLQSIQRYTPEDHELWVVDNNSPQSNSEWLLKWPDINVIFNRTEPIPPNLRGTMARLKGKSKQQEAGSYANAIALELAARLIEPQSKYLMTLHMDTMACHTGWLTFLKSKLSDKIGAAGIRLDRGRTPEGVLHVLGYLVDFQLFRRLGLDFMPELPRYDVGDRVTVALREAGYGVFACHNTLWEPELIKSIPSSSPMRQFYFDRAFDDNGNVIFLHLGRGISKSFLKNERGTTPKEWIRFAERYLDLKE